MPRISAKDIKSQTAPVDVAEPADVAEPDQGVVAVAEPPKPPEPPETPRPEPHPAAADAVARRAAELAAAEVLLLKEVNDELLTPDENEFLRHLFPAQFEREQELQRVSKYRRLQTAAGTVAERAAAEENAAAATEKLAIQGEGIRSQISKLETALLDLEKAASDANGERDRRAAAVVALADSTLLAEPARSRYSFERKRWEQCFGIPARVAKQQADGCDTRAAWTVGVDDDAIAEYCQSAKDSAVREIVSLRFAQPHANQRAWGSTETRDQRFVTINAMLWQNHTRELLAKASELRDEADRLEAAGEPLKAELDAMRESLIPA